MTFLYCRKYIFIFKTRNIIIVFFLSYILQNLHLTCVSQIERFDWENKLIFFSANKKFNTKAKNNSEDFGKINWEALSVDY